jgi:sugar phosphate isomerase/epimerase
MPLKLSTKFDPQPAKVENAHRAGFRYAEIWLDPAVLANGRAVAECLLAYPLGYALHFPNKLNLEPLSLEQTVALYRQLRCQSLVIHQPMHDKFRAPLLALDAELCLAVENHRLDPAKFEEWAQRNPYLTLDVEHLWKFTLGDGSLELLLDSVRDFLARFGHKLRHVHLPGYWPGFREHRPMYCSREMILPVLSLLAEARYEGFIVSEVEGEYQNIHELRMDVCLYEAWRELYLDKKSILPKGES